MIWRRTILLALLGIMGLALESAMFGEMTLNGTKPALLLLITVSLALSEGPLLAMTAGFVFGLMTDVVIGAPAGVTALTYTVAGYAVGRIRMQMQAPSAWMPIAMVAFATCAAMLFYGGFSVVLGQESLPPGRVLRHAMQGALYNGVLTPFLYPLVRALGGRLRPRAAEVLGR